jgi:phosphoribosylglycinamide formyltransferase-1
MSRLNVGVLASGRGTDFQSIIDAVGSGTLDVNIAVLICNNPGAYALERAREHGIDHAVVDHRGKSRQEFEEELAGQLDGRDVGLVMLAGFMRILTAGFIRRYEGRMINIHPSLLPSFPGAHAHRDALKYGVKVSGCTIHFVTGDVDGGPVIMQRAVEVREGDTEETLGARVLEEEHRILPEVVRLFAEGRLKLSGRHISIIE